MNDATISTQRRKGAETQRRNPNQEFVPCVGSKNWEMMSSVVQGLWMVVHASPCLYCGKPIGQGTWMLEWDAGRRAHLGCHEDMLKAENDLLANASLMDDAARTAKLTIVGFKALPTWERLRLMNAEMEKRK